MRYLLLTAALAMNMQAMLAQSSYQVKNSVTLRNEDCDLTKMSVILPVPVSNIYQDVVGLKGSSGTVLDLDASNRYLRDIKTDGQIDGRTNRLITTGRQQSGALIIELVEKK